MNSINMIVLEQLANADLKAELQQNGITGVGDTEFALALREQILQEKKDAAKNAAKEVLVLLKNTEQRITEEVETLREMRARVAWQMSRIKKLNEARDYGMETNNFLPLAMFASPDLSLKKLLHSTEMYAVPKDWKKAEETVATKPPQAVQHAPELASD